jgi:hypothetical protein
LTIFEDRILAQPEISGQIDPDMITINAMARHKEFDRDVALVEAIKVFSSSTAKIISAMHRFTTFFPPSS